MRYGAALPFACVLLLSACTHFGAAVRGEPDFPSAGMLPPETQVITAAAQNAPAAGFDWSHSTNCNAAIQKDNSGILPTDPIYRVERNNCIEEFIGAIDYQYNAYKEEVFRLANGINASTDALGTILSAGAAAAGGSTGQILSGITAGMGTLKGNLNQDVLYNQTITAIIAKMDADRADRLKVVLQQMQTPMPNSTAPPYTMYAASVDLLAYFEAGTVHHAIVDLESTAGAQAVSCQAAVNNLKETGTPTGGTLAAAQRAGGC